MKTNSFSQKMTKKSNKELEHLLEQKELYTDEAVQAVIWELENRNLIEKDTIKLAITPLETQPKELEFKNKEESPFEELVVPVLYSKNLIKGFTILFSTFFGAILLMSNFKEMNKPKARIEVLIFGIFYTVFTGALLNYLPKTFFLTLIFNLIGYLILIEYYWKRNLGKALEYKNKSMVKPLIISLIFLVIIVFLQFSPTFLEK